MGQNIKKAQFDIKQKDAAFAFKMYRVRKSIERANSFGNLSLDECSDLLKQRRELLKEYYSENFGTNIVPLF